MSFMKNVSKFRLVKVREDVKQVYPELRLADPTSTSQIIASAKWIAFNYGSLNNIARITLLPAEFSAAALPAKLEDLPCIQAHGDSLGDFAFSPFHADLMLTGSKDTTVKVWSIPEAGLSASMVQPTRSIGGFEPSGVCSIKFHTSAHGMAAVSTRSALSLVDVEAGTIVSRLEHDIVGCAWAADGGRICTLGKDFKMRWFDPRRSSSLGGAAAVYAYSFAYGLRPTDAWNVSHSDESDVWMAVGSNKMQQPSIGVVDARRPDAALLENTLDGLSSGAILSRFDSDARLLYVAQRSGTNVFTYDVSDLTRAPPRCDAVPVKGPVHGIALLPKYACNVMGCEVDRLLKLSNNHVSVLHATVERKVVQFHEDLFPPTASNKATLTAAEYLGGKDANPFLLSLDPAHALFQRAVNVDLGAELQQKAEQEKIDSAEQKKQAELDAYAKSSDKRASIDAQLKSNRLRNLAGKEPLPQSLNEVYHNLQPGVSLSQGKSIAANDTFWATPWRTLGGSALLVWPINKLGRLPDQPALVRGHPTPLTAFALSPVQQHLLATGASDGVIKLWNIPAGGVSKDLIDSQASLRGCNGRVSALQFHPFASNVLASADFGLDVGAVRLWDAAQGQQRSSIEGHNDVILDLQFSPNGSMLATSCKDGNIRLIDPRAGRVVSSWATPECYKDCSLVFASDHSLISVGCARQSARFVSLWDIRNTQSAPVGSKLELDPSNVCPIPFVDRDSNLLYLAHTGERTVQYVQILEGDDASLTLLGQYQSAELIGAIVPRSKQACDVRSVTMMTTLALTKRDVVTPIQFRLQRKRLEYFQDDLYPPTRSTVGENWLSADAWFGGSTVQPELVSLMPADMSPLSQAPAEALTHRQQQSMEFKKTLTAPTAVGHMGQKNQVEVLEHFTALSSAGYVPKSSRWDAKRDEKNEVAEDEWD